MFKERFQLYQQLEEKRKAKLLVYITSDRQGMGTHIAPDMLPYFTQHLDKIGDQEKICLYLYTVGGQTLAAWSLINLLRSYCKELEIILPARCLSAGTLICLGANNIIMTRQATLGPIDPSTNGPLNPQVPVQNNQMGPIPVNVESVYSYLEMAKKDLGITDQDALAKIYIELSQKIHPLTLGEVYKAKRQIQMLAGKLLTNHNMPADKQEKIINFLCSESGSHDYTINRKEAKEDLGLNIESPDADTYNVINAIYHSIEQELLLNTPFIANNIVMNAVQANYSCRRCLIESPGMGTHVFITEGTLIKMPTNPGQPQQLFNNNTQFEGWKYEGV